MVLLEERAEFIIRYVEENGFVKTSDLIELCQVSKPTIIRDLQRLEQQGFLVRTHGGVKSVIKGTNYELKQTTKEQSAQFEKHLIALKAKEFIQPGETILLDSGTTTLALAQQLHDFRNLTVITNDIKIAMCLCENEWIDIVVLGGQRRKGVYSLIGPITENTLTNFHVDKVFLGADAVDIHKGITNSNIDETNIKRIIIELAKEVILLADSSKFGTVAFMKIAEIGEIDKIITDEKFLTHQILSEWEKTNVEIIHSGAGQREVEV